jgi:transposase
VQLRDVLMRVGMNIGNITSVIADALIDTLKPQQLRQALRISQEMAQAMVARHEREVAFKQALIDKLTHEMAVIKRLKFAAQSEKFAGSLTPEQQSLIEETVDTDLAALAAEIEVQQVAQPEAQTQAKQAPKRQPLPAHLPRLEIGHEPADTTCGCGQAMKRIGQDVAERLDYVPGVFTVERHVRGKWVCRCCQTLVQAPVPAHVIDKGIPTASLLAQVLVAKYLDHLPLYRQEAVFERAGQGNCAFHPGAVGGRMRRPTAAAGGRAGGRDAQAARAAR